MSGPKDIKTLEIARRTRKNLQFIDNAKKEGKDVEEFTQLLNSMLGMVISLREDFFKTVDIPWDVAKKQVGSDWDGSLEISGKEPSQEKPNLKPVSSFSGLISNIRHAFSHNNYLLIVDQEQDLITGVTLWNLPPRKPDTQTNRIWEADISETQLRRLAYLFVDFVEKWIQ
jgi:hypothetical protein